MTIQDRVPRGSVTVPLNFYLPPLDNSPPHQLINPTPGVQYADNFRKDFQPVLIQDIRGRESSFNLDQDAFQIIQSLPPSAETQFTNDSSIKQNLYPEVERLLLDTIKGSNRIHIFDHTIRRTTPTPGARGPVQKVHIDQTTPAVEKRIRNIFPDEAEALLSQRYRIVNVWRPLNQRPVESFPLAFASTSTLDDADFVPVPIIYPNGYTGETGLIRYNPGQKWYYLSGMTGDERILLECFDSESLKEGSGIGGRVPHTAFEDPRTREDAEGRESIEVRALVFGP